MIRRALFVVVLSVGLAGCCVSKVELAADVKAWQSFTDAVEPDLVKIYSKLPEPSRSTRLGTLSDNRDAIAAASSRAN